MPKVICLECTRSSVHAHDMSPEAFLDMTLARIELGLSLSLSLLGQWLTGPPDRPLGRVRDGNKVTPRRARHHRNREGRIATIYDPDPGTPRYRRPESLCPPSQIWK